MISTATQNDSTTTKFYGKYRGTVLNNIDPKQLGRLLVQVPDVETLTPSTWAMPCVPVGGIQNGFFAVPTIGAGVWIEYEQGDPDYPIWSGCYWGSAAEVPNNVKTAMPPIPSIAMQTPLQNGILITDLPGPTGGIQLKTTTGSRVSITDLGIEVDNAKGASIKLIGPTILIDAAQVIINNGALMVT